jgi:hypothetical protein
MTSRQCNCRYIFILTFSALVLLGSSCAFAQADTTATDSTNAPKVKKPELAGRQLCIGMDYFHPIVNYFATGQGAYEITADYYTKNEYYLVMEGGWGWSNVNYPNLLNYTTKNSFLDFGFNKTVLPRDRPTDWDKMFIGLSLAGSYISRERAHYTIVDPLWGIVDSYTNAQSFPAIWAELSGGVRVELWKGICAGWTARGKFMLNGKSFNNLSPQYIAGYGQGEKNVVFDADMYISYSIRWKRKGVPLPDKKTAVDAAKPALAPDEKKDGK